MTVHKISRLGPLLGAVVLVAGIATACSTSGSGGGTEGATSSASEAVLLSSTPFSTSTDWVAWDKSTCKFVPQADHPASYTAQLRKPSSSFTLGYGEQGTGNPLLDAMNSDVTADAQKAGITLAVGNYNYPDKSDAISQSRAIALRNPAAVISFNVDKTVLSTVNQNYSSKCVPIIQVTLPADNTLVFGASDQGVGKAEGGYLANYAKQQGWNSADTTVYGVQVPSLAGINDRVTTCQNTVASMLPGVKIASSSVLTSVTASAQTAATNWLTAHPEVKHVLGCNISDGLALGEVNALQAANRSSGSAIIGAGGTASVLQLVGKSAFIGSVDFGYGHYGDFLVAMAEDAVAGKPLPTAVYTPLKVITSA